jgi:predicted MPP superfamily phosphohydrolase
MDGRSHFDGPKIALLIELLIKIAPIYAVSGNHERKNRDYYKIWRTMLTLRGVHFMNNKVTRIEKDGMTFVITGMRDISASKICDVDLSFLNELEIENDECHLVLHHKQNLWRSYYPLDPRVPDVVFSGHAHGGQVRLPLIKRGMFAPNQGLFAKYISGLYCYPDGSKEVVSRGLASSTKPIRINNRPHIPIVELYS